MDWCERGFLTIDDVRLEYSCIGPPPSDAPTVILLHEGLGCVDLWRDFPEKLSNTLGCGVFSYSRQGYGASDHVPLPRPLNYMTLEAINVLPEIIEHLSPTQFQLIGHSDGATIAAIYAGDLGHDKLSGITLIAPHFFTEDMGITQIKAAKRAFETTDLPEKLGKYHRDAENAFYGWNQSWLHPDFRSWDVQDVIEKITTPILTIQGVDDQYGTLQQIESIKARARASLSVEILQDCKHSPHLEHPAKVLDAIKTFSTAVRYDAMWHALPPYAYIPGQTQRHQEAQFDEIISSIPSVIDFDTLQTLSAFHTALNYMQHGFHWEAHEILEAIWMNTAQNSIERLFTQCIIHLANANLKHIMKRKTATQKIMTQANALSAEIGRRAPDSLAVTEIQKLFSKHAL